MNKLSTSVLKPISLRDEHSELMAKVSFENGRDYFKVDINIGEGLFFVDYRQGYDFYQDISGMYSFLIDELIRVIISSG